MRGSLEIDDGLSDFIPFATTMSESIERLPYAFEGRTRTPPTPTHLLLEIGSSPRPDAVHDDLQ